MNTAQLRKWIRTMRDDQPAYCTVIVPAAGTSSRFGVQDKLMADLNGDTVLHTTLKALDATPEVMAIIVAIAAPPIPGSALTVFPIMLSVAGIPLDYYPVAIILGTVLGYFLPVLNGFCLQLEMVLIADKLDMIDRDVLREPAKD